MDQIDHDLAGSRLRHVKKRDGSLVPFDAQALREAMAFAVQADPRAELEPWFQRVLLECWEGMEVAALQQIVIHTAMDQITPQTPWWQMVAARALLWDLYHAIPKRRGYGYELSAQWVRDAVAKGIYSPRLGDYSDAELTEVVAALDPTRDFLLTIEGLQQLVNRYLVKDTQGNVLELPQERWLAIALHLARRETHDRVYWARRFYEVLSNLEATVATPTLANMGRPLSQGSSCFISMPTDDLQSIYRVNDVFAQVSKYGGGMGIYLGKVRSRGATIRQTPNAAGGIVPWARVYDETAVAVNQLGVRSGAVTITLDVWHPDILEFVQVRRNNGDQRLKAFDIFPAVAIPDAFMRALEARADWYLFDPAAVQQTMGFTLEDSWGEEFERRYAACVANTALPRKQVPALTIMREILDAAFETGTPFVVFRDTVNRMNPNKHCGMIYSSNLCQEIAQNMSPDRLVQRQLDDDGNEQVTWDLGDMVVCNLSSLNLGKCPSKERIRYVVATLIRMMDAVIDENWYPVPGAAHTNKRYRAVGLGTSGYAQYLAKQGIPWESDRHLQVMDDLYEWIAYCAIEASMELAKEYGPYAYFAGSEWETGEYFDRRRYHGPQWDALRAAVAKHGVRNGYLMAIAPTGTTSLISGSSASVDPVPGLSWVEKKKDMLVQRIAPEWDPDHPLPYDAAHAIDQQWIVLAAAVRQRHLDQSQSVNLFVDQSISAKAYLELYLSAWRLGMKTVYYVRNRVEDDATRWVADTLERGTGKEEEEPAAPWEVECVGCEA